MKRKNESAALPHPNKQQTRNCHMLYNETLAHYKEKMSDPGDPTATAWVLHSHSWEAQSTHNKSPLKRGKRGSVFCTKKTRKG